jgi:DNA gyrase subunit A
VLIVTRQGKGIRFAQDEVRPMGLPAGGVGAIRLAPGDIIVAAELARKGGHLLTLTAKGWAKMSSLTSYPAQKRYGGGIITHKISRRNGNVAVACVVGRGGSVDLLTAKGKVERLALKDFPRMGRSTLGKATVEVRDRDEPVAIRNQVVSDSVKAAAAKEKPKTRKRARSRSRG